jgi:pimeloyl-ACP methyl ester carboxylesterase
MAFLSTGDLKIYYVERGEGVPIVFVPGNWATTLSWQPVLDRLPGGYRGISYDVRGRGKTEGPDNDYTMPELASDLLAFVDALQVGRFHLVGHSLGSAIAMQFALDHPKRLNSLVVVAPGWVDGMPAAYDVPAAQQTLKDNKAVFTQAFKAMMPTLTDDAYFEQLVEEGHEQRIEATMRNLPALLSWQPGDKLKGLGVPSLVIDGALDLLTGGANADRAAAALGAEHIVMQGVGHSPNIEAPDAFVALMLDFISRNSGK